MNRIQKIVGSLVLGAVLATSLAATGLAQDGRWNDRWERRDDRWDRRDDRWDRRNDRRNDRWDRRNDRRDGRGDRRNDRREDRWDRRNDRRNDRWDNNGWDNSYAREQMEKGYRDGLDRGRKDAQTNRARTPENSSHYRKGNQYYRQGFERGFYQAYNQYSDYDRGRRW